MSNIFYSDTISLSTKGFGDTVDITPEVTKIHSESGMTLDKITTEQVMQYVACRRKQGNCRPATRNREIATLSKAFNLARLWRWTKENSCQLVKREKEDNEIGRCITMDEEVRILDAAKGFLRGQFPEMIILALNTGMRLGEIPQLDWSQIDLFGRLINTVNEKTDKPKTVVMNETVTVLFKEKAKTGNMNGYVFASANGTRFDGSNLRRAWHSVMRKAKITGRLRFHDMRHTVGTRLTRAGCDIFTVASVLDHSQLSTTKRYARHSVESLRRAVNGLDRDSDVTFSSRFKENQQKGANL